MAGKLYGFLAEFGGAEELLSAARRTAGRGYRRVDAFTPYPLEEVAHELGLGKTRLPLAILLGGLAGGAGGYCLQWYAMAVSYPLNVGGRPLHSWPYFIPVTFELTILFAAFAGVAALFFATRLPRPHHPLFAVPGFERASDDRFFLLIERADPLFDPRETRRFLETLGPLRVVEVPS